MAKRNAFFLRPLLTFTSLCLLTFSGTFAPAMQTSVRASDSYDCSTIEGLGILDLDLQAQADGGWNLFESLSEECQLAYIDAQSIAYVDMDNSAPSIEVMQSAIYAAASGCTPAWVSAWHYNYFGSNGYRYVYQEYFCFNGSNVYSTSHSQWIDNVHPNYYWVSGRLLSNQRIGTGYWKEVQGIVDNCIFKYGCVGRGYPGGWIQTYGSGYWDGHAWSN